MGVTGSDASIDGGSYEELLELNAQGIAVWLQRMKRPAR